MSDLVVSAAQLEGKNGLQVFALQQYSVAGPRGKTWSQVKWGFDRDVVDLRVENSFEVIHGKPIEWETRHPI